ncbi:hypothetical protein C8J23_1176 [Shewanella chilikensis]|uniref:Uncharacterized protein n=1 Tax=Shewanella chilikensis TaxID=558541 RepID=A0ABX5PMK8_9GAMM|nr:hypothetical protein C8J23_1176 [Shewanella chilikensis]
MKPVPWFDGLKRWHFALATVLLFGIEVLIARYAPPGFIRGFMRSAGSHIDVLRP